MYTDDKRKPMANYIGRRFGKLVVTEYVGYDFSRAGKTNFFWKCLCDCGGTVITYSSNLSGHHIESCGCLKKGVDLTGNRYGKLTVIRESEPKVRKDRKSVKRVWECKCDCGKTTFVIHELLVGGHTKSCGCMSYRKPKDPNAITIKHKRLYKIWCGMRDRCNNPKDQHHTGYYDRGIRVCDEWNKSFTPFLEWALNNGYKDTLTIDRIDVNGNYEPSNCRWATNKEQQYNKQNTVRYNVFGEYLTAPEISMKYNVNLSTFKARVSRYGYSPEAAITTPCRHPGRKK